jgi:Na+/H+ antiporter NhaA
MVGMTATTGRQTTWQDKASPLSRFVDTETLGAAALLAAVVAALVWANVNVHAYQAFWNTALSMQLGDYSLALSLRGWVNSGLMTFFFFVVGLEARREFDLGDLRDRRRIVIPLVAALGAMTMSVLIYVALNAGHRSVHAWGAAMNTDTAIALGVLALVGRGIPSAVRILLLTMSVVDDVAALLVIALVYSGPVRVVALLVAVSIYTVVLVVRGLGVRSGLVYFLLAVACWFVLRSSGVDPIVLGLAMGLIAFAYPAPREQLERATNLFRAFREQPTPELARSARLGVAAAISPNDRLQQLYHPWTSYLIVPLFALANAGVAITGDSLHRAFTSPIGIGIVAGLAIGKPIGTFGMLWLLQRISRHRLNPPAGWAGVLGAGTVSGIGFTVSLLVAGRALDDGDRDIATVGVLASIPVAAALTSLVFLVTRRLPKRKKIRALYGEANVITDLALSVDPERDHIRGPMDAPVTVVEYGDFECPFCGQAEPVVRELLSDFGDVRYVWRHLPLTDVHPHAQSAAEAAQAAAAQGAFWEMHDLLFRHQDALTPEDLIGYAEELGLDTEWFARDLRDRKGAEWVAADVESADMSSVSGTPTFFINGRRHHGAYDIGTLTSAVRTARARAYERTEV